MRKKLTRQETRLLGLLYKYRHKRLNMKAYAFFLGKTRRWTRILMSNLRKKGYVKRFDEEKWNRSKTSTLNFVLIDDSGQEVI